MAIFETQNLAVGYTHGKQATTLLCGLNLSLDSGQLVALLGQNGAGKSTLIRALTFATKPIEGKILLHGVDFDTITKSERARLLGLVSTERIQAGALTVSELVGLGRQPYTGFLGRLSYPQRGHEPQGGEFCGKPQRWRTPKGDDCTSLGAAHAHHRA